MPRQPRYMAPGVAAHIVQRGHNRAVCFRRDSDYLLYLLHLRELSEKHGCHVHAYCLMTNHVHILLTPATSDACTLLMRDLGQRYVQHFNRRYGRTGTLWEGRFRSFIAETARYVLACYRYIELNPVDAGMVNDPATYPWSSYGANTGTRVDSLLSRTQNSSPWGARLRAGMQPMRAWSQAESSHRSCGRSGKRRTWATRLQARLSRPTWRDG
jgi:putative transposase